MKLIAMIFLAATAIFSGAARAGVDIQSMMTMKQLVSDALSEGSSEGVVSGDIAEMFNAATHSNEPIHITMKKIKTYDHGCGRLHVTMSQPGIKDINGHPTTGTPEFEFSICPNGQPPHEEVERVEEARRAAMKSCSVKIEKGSIENNTGAMRAVIAVSGCPANGQSRWRYTGACKALEMPGGIDVSYPIDKKGNISIQLMVPPQCITAQNSWHAVVIDANKTPLGDIRALW